MFVVAEGGRGEWALEGVTVTMACGLGACVPCCDDDCGGGDCDLLEERAKRLVRERELKEMC